MTVSFDSIVGFVGAAAAVTAITPTWSKWARDMWGRKIIQTALLLIVAGALVYDGIDRAGFLWPSPSDIAAARIKAEATVDRQAVMIDELRQKNEALMAQSKPTPSSPGTAVVVGGNVSDRSHIRIKTIVSTGQGLEVRGNVQGSSSVEADEVHSGVNPDATLPSSKPK